MGHSMAICSTVALIELRGNSAILSTIAALIVVALIGHEAD